MARRAAAAGRGLPGGREGPAPPRHGGDLDGNGHIDPKEFTLMLRRMGILLPPDDEGRLFKAMDGSGSGHISLQDFIKNYPTIMALERKAEVPRSLSPLDGTNSYPYLLTQGSLKKMDPSKSNSTIFIPPPCPTTDLTSDQT
jgi:hypothetical protein